MLNEERVFVVKKLFLYSRFTNSRVYNVIKKVRKKPSIRPDHSRRAQPLSSHFYSGAVLKPSWVLIVIRPALASSYKLLSNYFCLYLTYHGNTFTDYTGWILVSVNVMHFFSRFFLYSFVCHNLNFLWKRNAKINTIYVMVVPVV